VLDRPLPLQYTKGKENKSAGGTRAGHRVQSGFGLGWHPLHLLCFCRRRSLSLLASRSSHLSEAVNASGSVRVLGRLPNDTRARRLPQTCRWVPSDCLLHFPNHYPLHAPRILTFKPPARRSRFDLHTPSTPINITLSTSAQPSPALPKLRSTPSMRQPRSRDPTTTARTCLLTCLCVLQTALAATAGAGPRLPEQTSARTCASHLHQ